MPDAQPEDREKVVRERLEALEWAMENPDLIQDRIVKAYVLRFRKLVEEEERQYQSEQGTGQGDPAPADSSG